MHHSGWTGRIPDSHLAGLGIISSVSLCRDLSDLSVKLVNFIIDLLLSQWIVLRTEGGCSLLDDPHRRVSSISEG